LLIGRALSYKLGRIAQPAFEGTGAGLVAVDAHA
jgi:hypothetical protein